VHPGEKPAFYLHHKIGFVSVIADKLLQCRKNTRSRHSISRIKLPPGSTMAGSVWIDPNGKWAYVTHVLGRRYDTPSLIEAYRTAPYYRDGRARTIREALTKNSVNDRHGNLSDLTLRELYDLIAYVLSL
jgi:hypothetical protein